MKINKDKINIQKKNIKLIYKLMKFDDEMVNVMTISLR